jgi:formate hydrogenlyase subunit 3/multisubunit Na+/H+ antiporter MnhD subunit
VDLYLAALTLCLAGILAAIALPRAVRVPAAASFGAAACVCSLVTSLQVLTNGRIDVLHSSSILPLTGINLMLDPLGATFIATAAMVGLAACIFLVGYAKEGMQSRTAVALFVLFLLSLIAVPAASSIATLMFFWELMALSSMLLIMVEHRHRNAAREAAQWYGAMTQLGAASILLGLLLLTVHGGGQTFAQIATHARALSPAVRSAGFLFVLLGFASKAGSVPFHVWLPKAHPEAPGPVSALMSGAMVAMGVYGIIRVGGGLLGGGTLWWWIAVVALGVVSALYGALHATASSDLKRLLAYSTIDIMGLVLVGVGAAGALSTTGHPEVAQLSLIAALLLVVAHSAFKGCLFLAAGSIERSAGTRDLDSLGGLIRRLPITATFFAISAFSIIAIPTLSGFSSEWLLLQGLLHGFVDHNTPTLIALLLGVVALALTGGLTAVAFVKAFGIGFLGQARTEGAASAIEVALSMQLAMGLLCIPTVVLGVVPGIVIPLLARAARAGLGLRVRSSLAPGTGLALRGFRGAIEPAFLLVALAAAYVTAWAVSSLVARGRARQVEAWGCGRELQTARMQYTATSFGEPLQRVFTDVLRPDIDVEVTHESESQYYEQALAYQNRVDDALERSFYRPMIGAFQRAGTEARRIQNGSIHRYLAFGFVALLIVLVVLA